MRLIPRPRARPRVLVVDDDPVALTLLRGALESAGHEALTAADGRTALRRIDRERPEILLLDVMLPAIDGWGVLRELADRPHRPRVVIVSGKTSDQDVVRAFQLGASAYVGKPFGVRALIDLVAGVMARTPGEDRARRAEVLAGLTGPDGGGAPGGVPVAAGVPIL